MDDSRDRTSDATANVLDRLSKTARLALLWERAWPGLVACLMVLGCFLTASWLGLWIEAPRWARAAGLAGFALALLWPAWLLSRVRIPGRAEAIARVDRDSAVPHRPAATLDDALANSSGDASTRALWAVHQRRANAVLSSLKVAAPSPRLPLHDRFALRAAVLVAVLAAAFVAGPQKYARVAAAFDFRSPGAAAQGVRIDAWIDPPPYTGRAPVLLRTAAEGAQAGEPRKASAPAGSTVIVRTSEGAAVTWEATGGLQPPAAETAAEPRKDARDAEQRWTLQGDAQLVLKRQGSIVGTFDISAAPDKAPVVSIVGDPKGTSRGSLILGYKIEDDYGVLGAEVEFTNPRNARREGRGSSRSLVEPPKMPLGLPAGPGGLGEAETTADLSEHPWAGARVTLKVVARDEGGNAGRSAELDVILPQRPFVKPLARAIIEQRRDLALSPDQRERVLLALQAVMIDPERFGTGAGPYLGLHTITRRLESSRDDDSLREVVDLMWEMALRLEEGDLSGAEKDLKAAQEALRDAMQRGAPEDEIRRLMDQLRAALDKFLQEFADRQMQNQQDQDQQADRNDQQNRTITSQDLRRMLDRMEDMARSGDMADAQRMLDQLQNLLENLKSARRGDQGQMSREMNRSLNQLDQMMRDQQDLRDRTFRQGRQDRNGRQQQQGQRGRNQQNSPSQQGEQESGDESPDADSPGSLRERQEALRRQLEDLQRRMRQFGMKPEQGFGDAEDAMREAEGQLGQGRDGQGRAVDAQGRALEGLRRGAQSLAQQMQPGDQPGDQAGPGDPNGPGPQGRNSATPDPLGRESRERGDQSRSLYDPPGLPAAQRAQRVLEELRRRLSDPARPRDEVDYLERLLRRY
ncbi:MAG: hypothetical protein JWN93_1968 [Hyphomicrobiales bacterium]|nr:hypothetical protein [Hyphomicrobiales bacterium]